ncbi:Nramp family divalent metal transporter [Oceaniserpentilla sp. 4NH20-0058]|uniref:Nramp family divalent metal transporter n=1 Tax=Oceaniserpentilla sp. 4NH20-0058 TaxID=3127660 RepID=UPI00310A97BF
MLSTKLNQIYLFMLPGLLMAMTGVGVGDLATAGFTGAQLGTTVLWAVVLGGIFKFVLTEGIARWQLASNTSIIQGGIHHIKKPFIIFMVIYFVPWCWFVGGALINAAGVAAKELAFLMGFEITKISGGIFHSVLALILLFVGKQALFSKVMSVLAVLLFATVITCAFMIPVNIADIVSGLFVPVIPDEPEALSWTLALMGGVGGTLTVLCYGYWLANSEREGVSGLNTSRWDIGISYALTCLFGIAMVVIGSVAVQNGKGLSLLLSVSQYFSNTVHPFLGGLFLVGAWAAIFSSLLGVWQAVPLIFADAVHSLKGDKMSLNALPNTRLYKIWLVVLAVVPMLALVMPFKEIQKLYSVVGAFFMPILAMTLLWLNNKHVSTEFKNGFLLNVALIVVLFFFVFAMIYKWA